MCVMSHHFSGCEFRPHYYCSVFNFSVGRFLWKKNPNILLYKCSLNYFFIEVHNGNFDNEYYKEKKTHYNNMYFAVPQYMHIYVHVCCGTTNSR